MKEFDSELTSGSIFRSVWKLAWPVILLQLISGIHGFVAQSMVGRHVGPEASAAIGVAWQLFLVMVVFISSLFQGLGVLVAQYTGKNDRATVNRVTYDVFLACFYIFIFIAAPFGYFTAPYLLGFMEQEPEVVALALPYLRILFTASAPMFMIFMLNNALQAAGDPRTPLILGVMTTILNIVFSSVLIVGFGPIPSLGANGAALGTVLGPVPSVIVAMVMIMRRRMVLGPPDKFRLIPDMSVIRAVARIGIPTGIQAVVLNVGGVLLLRFIGSLDQSVAATAAYTICYTQLFSFVTWASFGLRASASTIMGQNIGAGKPARGKRGVYIATGIAIAWSGIWAIVYTVFPQRLLSMFGVLDGAEVYVISRDLLSYLAISGFFVSSALAITGGLQGAGDTKKPMYVAIVTQIFVLLGICFALEQMDMLAPHTIWMAILVSHVTRLALTWWLFFSGDWAHLKIELGH